MVNEEDIDVKMFLRLLRLGETTFEQIREDLLLTPRERERMKELCFVLPDTARMLRHRELVWHRLVQILGREASRTTTKRQNRAAPKHALTR